MPAINPGTGIQAGNTLGGYLVGFAMRQLESGDRERINKSFLTAVEWACLSAEGQRKAAKGGMRKPARATKKQAKRFWQRGKEAGRKAGNWVMRKQPAEIPAGESAGIKMVADELTEAWVREAARPVLRSGNWISALEACVRRAAWEHSRETQANHLAWRRAITGGEQAPDEARIREWAGEISSQVVTYWGRDKRLGAIVAQFNAESGLGLQQALVVSSRGISRSLWWIATAVTAMTLVGGGGIALLVLFLDRG
jgi:hypothetical protein